MAEVPNQRPVVLEMEDVHLNFHTKRGIFDHGVHRVLTGITLELREGEALGVIGRNGCGKSTLLRLMAGILAPSTGRVTLQPGIRAALLTLGLGFKKTLSGRDNALLAAMLQGATRREAEARLEEIKDFAELGDSFEEPVSTYSSGMRARLGLSTALLTEVEVLLIDEVLSVGDAGFKDKAQAAIKGRITGHQTVVFVSHSDSQVEELCDRAIWIDQGRVAAEGETGEVVEAYRQSLQLARQERRARRARRRGETGLG